MLIVTMEELLVKDVYDQLSPTLARINYYAVPRVTIYQFDKD